MVWRGETHEAIAEKWRDTSSEKDPEENAPLR
jgi:hypothetical protein